VLESVTVAHHGPSDRNTRYEFDQSSQPDLRPEYLKYLVVSRRSSLVSFNYLWSPHLWKRLLTCSPSSCASWGQVLPCWPLLPMLLLLPLQRLWKLESSSGRPRLPPVPPSPSISFSVSPSQPNPSVLACLSPRPNGRTR
jgi:hypothetical protein